MMYEVEVKEILTCRVEVEAESPKEAVKKANKTIDLKSIMVDENYSKIIHAIPVED